MFFFSAAHVILLGVRSSKNCLSKPDGTWKPRHEGGFLDFGGVMCMPAF